MAKRCLSIEMHGSLEKTNETFLPEKEMFYKNLSMKDTTDADYKHALKVLALWFIILKAINYY